MIKTVYLIGCGVLGGMLGVVTFAPLMARWAERRSGDDNRWI